MYLHFFILPHFRAKGRNADKNFVGFLGDLETPSGHLEINWALETAVKSIMNSSNKCNVTLLYRFREIDNFRRNILSQLQLIVLVWPSSPPHTAHRFISEWFVPILPHKQLI